MSEAETRLKSLMLSSLDGDASAYRLLLRELADRLRAYYRRRLGDGCAETEDLVQETLIAVHARRASYVRTEPFTAWAYAIARYKLIDHLRRSKTRAAIPLDACEELFAADQEAQAAAARDVDRLLEHLPASLRDSIRLTRIEGLSIEEAARRTGDSPVALKVRIHRGLKRLARRYAGEPHEND